jgi:uncharacterized protein DUF6463
MGRIAGRLLVLIGLIHVLLFLWLGSGALRAVVRDGMWRAVAPHTDRLIIFWSLCFGVMGVFLGQLISWTEARRMRTPAWLGWELLGLGVLGAVLMPVSGWWVIILIGALIVAGSRRGAHLA